MRKPMGIGIVLAFGVISLCFAIHTAWAQSELAARVEELADKITSSTSAEIIAVEGDTVYLNLCEKDAIYEGAEFEVVRLGDPISVGGKVAYKEKPIGDIQVTKVRKDMSMAKVTSAAAEIQKGDKAYQKRKRVSRIALTEFPCRDSVNELSDIVYQTLSVSFVQKGLQVVERAQLQQILKEQKISWTGMIDTTTAQKLGQLLGTEAVLLGSITDMGNSIFIQARLVDAGKGLVLTAAQVEITKTPQIQTMLSKDNRGSITSGQIPALDTSGGAAQTATKGKPAKTERFVAYLSQATVNPKDTSVRLTIENTTSDPLLIALNQAQRPVMNDDISGLSLGFVAAHGISQSHMSWEQESSYTRISPAQSLDIGLVFAPFNGDIKGARPIHVTVDFLCLQKGKVQRIAISPSGNAMPSN